MPLSEEASKARTILDGGRFEDLIGKPEAIDLEYKSHLWDLSNTESQLELAKDVAGMANSSSGLIIIGVSTWRSTSSTADTVNGFNLSPIQRMNVTKIRQVIDDFIYPQIALSISAKPYHRDETQGILLLEILDAAQADRPFIVSRAPCGKDGKNGRELSDRFLMFPRRTSGGTTEYASKQLADWARNAISRGVIGS